MKPPPIAESLVMEMDPAVPEEALTRSGQLRRWMRSGEFFSMLELDTEKDRRLATMTLSQMKRWGYQFHVEEFVHEAKQMKRYRCLNPGHQPSEEQLQANRDYFKGVGRTPRTPKEEPANGADALAENGPNDAGRWPCRHGCGADYASPKGRRVHEVKVHDVPRQLPATTNGHAVAPQGLLGGFGLPAAPLGTPSLGAGLQVFLLHLDEEGQVSVGLRDGQGGQIMAQLTGAVR